ncbi:MAG: Sec-independent protein translocase protein TatB [Alphaproteobacteria bacterium]|nr:Sec-independent protein translocase protein TatB [Alphaproteobacteria bacterium]
MFDIGWSELLIIGFLALIVVGPKELPVLLRTLGRYVGVIRRQASEFRSQFDEVMRDTEIDQIRKDMAGIKQDVASTVHEASRNVEQDMESAKKDASVKDAIESNGGSEGLANLDDEPKEASGEKEVSEKDLEWLREYEEKVAANERAKAQEASHGHAAANAEKSEAS